MGLSISLCFCLLFIALISGQPLKQCFLYALRFLSMGALGMIVYFIGMKLSLYITHLELSTYKGMSEIGKIPLASIPSLI
ncbi:glucosyltransferase domain-containing protein, partial [Staphylococcus aureus]